MERKYYLRGLGLGIAVAAAIMGMMLSGSRTMTDDEIIARAKELGMVENTVLSEADSEPASQENMDEGNTAGQSEIQDNVTDVVDNVDSENIAADEEPDQQIESDDSEESDQQTESGDDEKGDAIPVTADDEEIGDTEKPAENISTSAVRMITINSGDGSYTVAKKLADAGVVTSAGDFDSFLCENGYDKRLRTGNFSIPADASDEQIARIVTGAE